MFLLQVVNLQQLHCSKYILEPHNIEDPNYEPLPEDRPGGYAWGQQPQGPGGEEN